MVFQKNTIFFPVDKNGFSQVPIHKDSPNLNVQIVIGPRYTSGPIYGSMTLADEDTNSILTDDANRAIQGNVAMQVTRPDGQLWKQCKWHHLMTKF